MKDLWQPLHDELAEWRKAGRVADLWLRDDDAVEPTPLLDRLIGLTEEFRIPVALAVIPARTGEALARRLDKVLHMHPLVHGWSHANHAPLHEKKQELGHHRPHRAVLDDLSRGFARLSELHGERLAPMLVPPWNRIDPSVLDDLPALGFKGLSAFGHKLSSRPRLIIANTHVDIIDSRAFNACRDHASLVAGLAGELARSRAGAGTPVGILSHHLVSGDEAFSFLRGLFTAAALAGTVRWRSPHDLLDR